MRNVCAAPGGAGTKPWAAGSPCQHPRARHCHFRAGTIPSQLLRRARQRPRTRRRPGQRRLPRVSRPGISRRRPVHAKLHKSSISRASCRDNLQLSFVKLYAARQRNAFICWKWCGLLPKPRCAMISEGSAAGYCFCSLCAAHGAILLMSGAHMRSPNHVCNSPTYLCRQFVHPLSGFALHRHTSTEPRGAVSSLLRGWDVMKASSLLLVDMMSGLRRTLSSRC